MKTIYRYEINQAVNDIKLPIGAEILSVGIVNDWKYTPVDPNDPCDNTHTTIETISLWVMVDTDNTSTETRRFLVFGTGADMSATETYTLTFIGTVQKK